MDITTVKNHIKQRTPSPFYIFTGPEVKLQDIYITKLANINTLQVIRVDCISDIFKRLRNRSFVTQNYCYVVRDDKEFMNNEKGWEELEKIIHKTNDMLVLLITNVDKRNKFYKKYKDRIVEFEYMTEPILIKYIQKDIDLSEDNCKKLIEVCENDYSRILLEIDKIRLFQHSDSGSKNYNSAFEELLDQRIIYQPPKDAIFDFVDAVLRRKKKAFDLLEQCYAVGESTIVLLSVLYNNVKQVLQVQSCNSNDIAKTTGLTGWQIKCAKEKMNYYSIGDLVYMLEFIQDVEKKIKTGEIEERIAIEYIMVNCM